MKKLALLIPMLLMACTEPQPASPEPGQIVYRTQGYYNAAVALETAYGKLPACGKPTSPPLCSDAAVKKKVRKIDEAAWVAIQEAQIAVRTEGFGESKITTFVTSATALTRAFTDIANTLPEKE